MARAKIHIDFDEMFFDRTLNSPAVRGLVDQAAYQALGEAKATAPVDSGEYRDSLHIEHVMHAHRQTAVVAADVPYALDVEARHGTLTRAAKKVRV